MFDCAEDCVKKTKEDGKEHSIYMHVNNVGFVFVSHTSYKEMMEKINFLNLKNKYKYKLDTAVGLGKNVADSLFITNYMMYKFPYEQDSRKDKFLKEYESTKKNL